jgi:hypothetical protein
VNTASCTERKVKHCGSCTDKTLGFGNTEKYFSPIKFHLRRSTIYKYTMTLSAHNQISDLNKWHPLFCLKTEVGICMTPGNTSHSLGMYDANKHTHFFLEEIPLEYELLEMYYH